MNRVRNLIATSGATFYINHDNSHAEGLRILPAS